MHSINSPFENINLVFFVRLCSFSFFTNSGKSPPLLGSIWKLELLGKRRGEQEDFFCVRVNHQLLVLCLRLLSRALFGGPFLYGEKTAVMSPFTSSTYCEEYSITVLYSYIRCIYISTVRNQGLGPLMTLALKKKEKRAESDLRI